MFKENLVSIIDYRTDMEIIKNLQELNIKVVYTKENRYLDVPINGHPDMVIFKYNNSTIIVPPSEYEYYCKELMGCNINIIKGVKYLQAKYPDNIPYNAVRINNCILHKLDYTDHNIIKLAKENHLKLIDVKQGYTKCSILNMQNNGLITADANIYNKLTNNGFDTLLIKPGFVDLEGYNYGFIGGASGFIDNTIYLTGNIENHPNKSEIKEFILKKNIKLIFLSKKKIYDYGTIIFLKNRRKYEK